MLELIGIPKTKKKQNNFLDRKQFYRGEKERKNRKNESEGKNNRRKE